ncbi:MAG: FliI/YscN family ATPase [Pseudomonadota bacterium]
MTSALEQVTRALARGAAAQPPRFELKGRVRRVIGETIAVSGCALGLGARCRMHLPDRCVDGEVIGLEEDGILVQPLGEVHGLTAGALVSPARGRREPCIDSLPGRVLNGLLEPVDGGPPLPVGGREQLVEERINPLERPPVTEPFDLGIRAVNALLTVGTGQRIGLFAGSGVGKSVLLGMIGRFARADVVVVGLVGERGREVREFVEENLGVGLENAVVVASPADDSPVMRIRAAFAATRVAERYRAEGKRVLLMMDSLTRVAQAQREVGLAAGEPPTTKGYTPSVFRMLPRLVERAGCVAGGGSITAVYTVLTEEDDLQEPVADAARAILDGHIVLDRGLADAGLYPAIDVSASISRVMSRVSRDEQQRAARLFKQLWGRYREQEDLISVGAYAPGADPVTDQAVTVQPRLRDFVAQDAAEPVDLETARSALAALMEPVEVSPGAAPDRPGA